MVKQEYPVHPAAEIFPMMTADEYQGLKDDIAENGQREDITVWRGQLIDGRNRLKACEELQRNPSIAELDDDEDPLAYVLSHNLHRRHLTTTQRSSVAGKIATMRRGGDRKSEEIKGSKDTLIDDTKSIAEAASQMKVSTASVKRAKKVHAKGSDAVNKAMDDGSLPVTTAAAFVDAVPDKAEQEAIVSQGPAAVKEVVEASAKAKPKAKPKAKAVDQQNEWVDVDDEDEIEESSSLTTDIDDDSLSAEIHASQNATASRGQGHVRQTQLSRFIVRWNQYQDTDKQDILEWLRKKYPQA